MSKFTQFAKVTGNLVKDVSKALYEGDISAKEVVEPIGHGIATGTRFVTVKPVQAVKTHRIEKREAKANGIAVLVNIMAGNAYTTDEANKVANALVNIA